LVTHRLIERGDRLFMISEMCVRFPKPSIGLAVGPIGNNRPLKSLDRFFMPSELLKDDADVEIGGGVLGSSRTASEKDSIASLD